jgi:lipopolysaccharide/colanic/teichoic acid biosynthesis glycosyltransferase
VGSPGSGHVRHNDVLKRGFDVLGSLVGLLVLAPVGAAVALGVRLRLGRPVLYRQRRPGRLGVPFEILKFRTMTDARDDEGRLRPDADRMTRLGHFVRSTSLDEIPEFVNVLRGEMSLVGPRPLLMQYLDRYTPEQNRRHEVRPGLTGWAQVHGRNASSWDDRLALDVWYVDHRTLWLDLKIVALTIRAVVTREGVSADGHVTMPEFQGRSAEPPTPLHDGSEVDH